MSLFVIKYSPASAFWMMFVPIFTVWNNKNKWRALVVLRNYHRLISLHEVLLCSYVRHNFYSRAFRHEIRFHSKNKSTLQYHCCSISPLFHSRLLIIAIRMYGHWHWHWHQHSSMRDKNKNSYFWRKIHFKVLKFAIRVRVVW